MSEEPLDLTYQQYQFSVDMTMRDSQVKEGVQHPVAAGPLLPSGVVVD